MGRTHVYSGMAAGAATLPIAPVEGVVAALAWVAVSGGAALVPDLDHPNATMTRMWGPLLVPLHKAVRWAGRGHRGGSHDIIVAPAVIWLIAWAASHHEISAGILIAVVIGLGIRGAEFVVPGRLFEHPAVNVAVAGNLAWMTAAYAMTLAWLPWALALGVVVHIIGDGVTKAGVPIPFTWLDGRASTNAGVLTTGRWYERWLIGPGLLIATLVLVLVNTPELSAQITAGIDYARGIAS